MGSNRRDVDLHLVGHDGAERMATTVRRHLDRLKRKLQKFTADSDKSLPKRGFDATPGFVQSFLRGLAFDKLGADVSSTLGPQFARVGIRRGVFAGLFAGAGLAQAGNIILAFVCL
jgi:hypothetical protein